MSLECTLFCHIPSIVLNLVSMIFYVFFPKLHTVITPWLTRQGETGPFVTSKSDLSHTPAIAILCHIRLCFTPVCILTLSVPMFVGTGFNLVGLFSCPGKCSSSFESVYTSVSYMFMVNPDRTSAHGPSEVVMRLPMGMAWGWLLWLVVKYRSGMTAAPSVSGLVEMQYGTKNYYHFRKATDSLLHSPSSKQTALAVPGAWKILPLITARILQPDSKVHRGQHGAHLGPVGPRWAPCWPHETCYQGVYNNVFVGWSR